MDSFELADKIMEKARLKLQERVRSQEDLLCFLCLTSN